MASVVGGQLDWDEEKSVSANTMAPSLPRCKEEITHHTPSIRSSGPSEHGAIWWIGKDWGEWLWLGKCFPKHGKTILSGCSSCQHREILESLYGSKIAAESQSGS